MIRLSAFGDEISPDLEEQLHTLAETAIRYLDLRSVWDVNVLELSDAQVAQIERALRAHEMRVGVIGSPLGKVPIDAPPAEQEARFRRALALAQRFETPFIRIFSFYAPSGGTVAERREEVLARLRAMTREAAACGITLLHENEKDIFGDTVERCLDLLQRVDDPHFAAIFDPANFVQCGQVPYPDAYQALLPWIRGVHVKDARADGSVAPAGEGVSRWPDLLRRLREDGFNGFFSLEPHLASAGQFGGSSGPDEFRRAVRAFRALLPASGWQDEA